MSDLGFGVSVIGTEEILPGAWSRLRNQAKRTTEVHLAWMKADRLFLDAGSFLTGCRWWHDVRLGLLLNTRASAPFRIWTVESQNRTLRAAQSFWQVL